MSDNYSVFQTEPSEIDKKDERSAYKLGFVGRALEGVALVALFFAIVMTLATSAARAESVGLAAVTQAHSTGLLSLMAVAFAGLFLGVRQIWRLTAKDIRRGDRASIWKG